jgi:excisionase family DNA binding protein
MKSNGQHPAAIDWASMPEWVDVSEAAEKAGYHPDHLRRLIRQGRIEAKKRGTMWWVDKASLLDYMATVEELGTKKHAGIPQHNE